MPMQMQTRAMTAAIQQRVVLKWQPLDATRAGRQFRARIKIVVINCTNTTMAALAEVFEGFLNEVFNH